MRADTAPMVADFAAGEKVAGAAGERIGKKFAEGQRKGGAHGGGGGHGGGVSGFLGGLGGQGGLRGQLHHAMNGLFILPFLASMIGEAYETGHKIGEFLFTPRNAMGVGEKEQTEQAQDRNNEGGLKIAERLAEAVRAFQKRSSPNSPVGVIDAGAIAALQKEADDPARQKAIVKSQERLDQIKRYRELNGRSGRMRNAILTESEALDREAKLEATTLHELKEPQERLAGIKKRAAEADKEERAAEREDRERNRRRIQEELYQGGKDEANNRQIRRQHLRQLQSLIRSDIQSQTSAFGADRMAVAMERLTVQLQTVVEQRAGPAGGSSDLRQPFANRSNGDGR